MNFQIKFSGLAKNVDHKYVVTSEIREKLLFIASVEKIFLKSKLKNPKSIKAIAARKNKPV